MRLLKNKKGTIEDLFIILIFSFVLIAVVVVAFKLNSDLRGALEDAGNLSAEQEQVLDKTETAISAFDVLFAILLVGLVASTLVGAFLLDTHPVFFWISLILLIIVVLLAVVIANVAHASLGGVELASSYAEFPIMKFFLDYLPLNAAILGALILAAYFVKRGSILGG